jgi:hypothetical protein
MGNAEGARFDVDPPEIEDCTGCDDKNNKYDNELFHRISTEQGASLIQYMVSWG